MTETTAEKKHITIGILAHVDAGKTTLSEELLYETGVRKQAGRVLTVIPYSTMTRWSETGALRFFPSRQSFPPLKQILPC